MNSFTTWGFTSPRIISWGDSVFDAFIEAIDNDDFTLQEDDIIIITSKVVSMEQKEAVELDAITASEDAVELSKESKMDPRVVQLVMNESNNQIYGSVFHAILAKNRFGLSANAGIDLSNSPEGYALLLPKDPDSYARKFREQIRKKFDIKVAVLVTDSRTIPLKRGTTGVTLGVAGIEPVVDERGKSDLYGYKMSITTRAIADNLATAANIIMGETSERRPFGVIRGISYQSIDDENLSMDNTMMPEDQCLYFAPFIKLLHGEKEWL